MSDLDMEKARAAQRAYAKNWRRKNPDKVRENNLRYWARRAEREELAEVPVTERGMEHATDATISENR